MGGNFFRSRAASEALGVLLLLAGVLALLSLYSYDPRDPNLFSLTTGDVESPTNWIGGFGASLSAALYQAYEDYHVPLNDVLGHLRVPAGGCGAVFASGGHILGADLYDRPATLAAYWPRLVRR